MMAFTAGARRHGTRTAIAGGDVVAPATEQSGVGHTITFLRPLVCKEIFDGVVLPLLGGRRESSRLRE